MVRGRSRYLVGEVEVGVGVDEKFDHVDVTVGGRPVQCCPIPLRDTHTHTHTHTHKCNEREIIIRPRRCVRYSVTNGEFRHWLGGVFSPPKLG